MTSHQLLRELTGTVSEMIENVQENFLPLSDRQLGFKPDPSSWSILQCFEHLNRYNRFYNAEIKKRIDSGESVDQELRSTWIGKKSVAAMHPDNRKKQRTLRHLNPQQINPDRSVVDEFLGHQKELLDLLDRAKASNLNNVKIPVEFFRLLKMNLGDALQFLIVHQQRHFLQMSRIRERMAQLAEGYLRV